MSSFSEDVYPSIFPDDELREKALCEVGQSSSFSFLPIPFSPFSSLLLFSQLIETHTSSQCTLSWPFLFVYPSFILSDHDDSSQFSECAKQTGRICQTILVTLLVIFLFFLILVINIIAIFILCLYFIIAVCSSSSFSCLGCPHAQLLQNHQVRDVTV